jgi:hypothetical protein
MEVMHQGDRELLFYRFLTNNSLMVQESGFIRGINPKSKILKKADLSVG